MLRILFYIVTSVIITHLNSLNHLVSSYLGVTTLSFHLDPLISESIGLILVVLAVHRALVTIKERIPAKIAPLIKVEFAIITLKYLSLKIGYVRILFFENLSLEDISSSQFLWVGYLLILSGMSVMCFHTFIRKSAQ